MNKIKDIVNKINKIEENIDLQQELNEITNVIWEKFLQFINPLIESFKNFVRNIISKFLDEVSDPISNILPNNNKVIENDTKITEK